MKYGPFSAAPEDPEWRPKYPRARASQIEEAQKTHRRRWRDMRAAERAARAGGAAIDAAVATPWKNGPPKTFAGKVSFKDARAEGTAVAGGKKTAALLVTWKAGSKRRGDKPVPFGEGSHEFSSDEAAAKHIRYVEERLPCRCFKAGCGLCRTGGVCLAQATLAAAVRKRWEARAQSGELTHPPANGWQAKLQREVEDRRPELRRAAEPERTLRVYVAPDHLRRLARG